MKSRCYSVPLLAALFFVLGILNPAEAQSSSSDAGGYKTPSAELAAIVDAPPLPGVSISPDRKKLLLMESSGLPALAELAAPELRIAGLRINPATNGPSRGRYSKSLALLDLASEKTTAVSNLPLNPMISNVSWSPDGKAIAFTNTYDDGMDLWVVDADDATASKKLIDSQLNGAFGRPYRWMPDSKGIIVYAIPKDLPMPPAKPAVPSGPIIQQSTGEVAAARTYQDLLKNPYDESLFEYFGHSQLMYVDVSGKNKSLLVNPGIIRSASPSPDGKFILVQTIQKPFSYLVPYYRFPHRIEVWNIKGELMKTVADLPLAESVPIGRGAVPTGIRSIQWRSDADSELAWVEAQDGGDPRAEAEIRDNVYTLAAPFSGEPKKLISLELRYAGIQWGNDNIALVNESWWSTRTARMWRVAPDAGEKEPEMIFDRSYEDRYNDPGSPVLVPNDAGRSVLLLAEDNESIYMNGQGASSEGDRPFLDQLNLSSKEPKRLWRSAAPQYERFVAFVNEENGIVLTRKEAPAEPPNYFARHLKDSTIKQITDFPHPYPQLAQLNKEVIRYKRDDGVMLTATLYLPPGKTPEDGPFPMLMWAYPREFKNAAAAGQMRGSPYRFNTISPSGPLPFLATGYAVLDGPTMPIIGEGDAEPNDEFVKQLVASAAAAIDEVVRRGVADRDRIAVGGHSYGAFMTANLLAHSDLFAAGIGRSGAYNRTLTPFGFQAEERTFWEDPDVYFNMSPFMHADQVNEPILLIHGEADNNSGTFPLQSRRYYNALKGHGAITRLVMLPHESHGYRARESVLHMLWEMNSWLDEYVKNAPG
jgi:dipeptidyl aminopeptidase/acylaminoacyl peptidase